ncbi:MAG: glycosidase [Bacteroidetes bacterium 4572_77]|nr:MAG: glycosidase [Bacteroidetes bacterium 4572_77]
MIKRTAITISANPKKVLPLFLDLRKKERIISIVKKVESMSDDAIEKTMTQILHEFEDRHIDFKEVMLNHFQMIADKVKIPENILLSRKLLIGAYFTKEYSIEAAALFNPSIALHPEQNELDSETKKFIMSLRATGEGHISSIVFRTGEVLKNGEIILDKPIDKMVAAKKNSPAIYEKSFISQRAIFNKKLDPQVFDYLPNKFSEKEAYKVIDHIKKNNLFRLNGTKKAMEAIFDTNYELSFAKDIPLNSKVIFPSSKAESMGMEDVRFIKFSEENKYYGTYTAYNGKNISVQLIETADFNTFKIRSLHGKAAQDKGMALFPEKINGKYAMISRQGGDNISIMFSDNIYFWDHYKILQKPEREWEMTQLGNSGSPIKTEIGWLLLTHAVGPLRKYVLSATLLDLQNPEIVLATLNEPLLSPNSNEREGYVPNVVYTCGFLQHGDHLFIPYAMSDSATSFATVKTKTLLDKLQLQIQKSYV